MRLEDSGAETVEAESMDLDMARGRLESATNLADLERACTVVRQVLGGIPRPGIEVSWREKLKHDQWVRQLQAELGDATIRSQKLRQLEEALGKCQSDEQILVVVQGFVWCPGLTEAVKRAHARVGQDRKELSHEAAQAPSR